MTTLNAATDFAVDQLNPLLTPEQAPRPDVDQSDELFEPGAHEAVITVVTRKGIATKELLEEIFLSREHRVRNGEQLMLSEQDGKVVIHQQFNVVYSVQVLLGALQAHKIDVTGIEFKWNDDAASQPELA